MAECVYPWMHLSRVALVSFLVFCTNGVSLADIVSRSQSVEARQLLVYSFYKDVQIFHYRVPVETRLANWTLFANETRGCASKNVSLHLQHGSFPVVSPDGAAFPPNFYTHRTSLHNMSMVSDSRPFSLLVQDPIPGDWFLIAYLLEKDDRIQQKGLFTKCTTWLSSRVTFESAVNVAQLLPGVALYQQIERSQYYKFYIPSNTWSVTVTLKQCGDAECPLIMGARPMALPSASGIERTTVNCTANYTKGQCVLEFVPYEDAWHYLFIHLTADKAEFQITVETTTCENGATPTQYLILSELKFTNATSAKVSAGGLRVPNAAKRILVPMPFTGRTKVNPSSPVCWPQIPLMKKTFPGAFLFEYVRDSENGTSRTKLELNNSSPTILAFPIQPLMDIGGTLTLEIGIDMTVNTSAHNVSVTACLEKGSRAITEGITSCSSGVFVGVNTSSEAGRASLVMVPFPEPGNWYVTLQSSCYHLDSSNADGVRKVPCEFDSTTVVYSVMSGSCVFGGCGHYGRCYQYFSGGFVYSTCICTAGWRGWGCTDASEAKTDFELLLATLLLTLSNLIFIPTVALAIYRHYYTEALVYFFTMFFSTFYHACDEEAYTFCLMRVSVMQFCDFYSAILSFWVTMIAMADLSPTATSFAHMAGALGVALGVEYDRTGLWVFVIPATAGVLVLLISWACHCYKTRDCYPQLRVWVCILPGVILAAAGLACFAFLETRDNYKYVHSSWHVAMALAVVFLLPPRRYPKGRKTDQPLLSSSVNSEA